MNEEEKRKYAQNELQNIKKLSKKIEDLWQRYEEIRSSLFGTGIDYSKDRVQTTPSNAMENIICDKLIEIEATADRLVDIRDELMTSIYKIEDDQECNVLIDVYVKYKSIRDIAEEMYMSKSSVHRLLNKALTSYYNTKYSIQK